MHDDERCDCRNGMRDVTEVFARQEAGVPRDMDLDWLQRQAHTIGQALLAAEQHRGQTTADGQPLYPMPDLALLELWAKYRAMLNTVYPCPTCRPQQFHRWRHGCYRTNHARSRCKLCREADGKRAA